MIAIQNDSTNETIIVSDWGGYYAADFIIQKKNIVSVGGFFFPLITWYKYATKTILVITTGDGQRHRFELQETAESTWNLGTKAALDQAIADVNSWLP